MLRITAQATTHLLRARTERGFDEHAAARFVRAPSGIGLTFAAVPEPGDHVLADISALPIYIADGVRSVLDQAVIDVAPDDGEFRLVVRSQMDAAQ